MLIVDEPTGLDVKALQSDVHPLKAEAGNFAQCVNAAAAAAPPGLLVTLPPDLVELSAGWRAALVRAAEANPRAAFLYGDYALQAGSVREAVRVRHDIGDITEREDWGPVWAVRTEWLRQIGGLDESNHRAAFYDLLLKSWGDGRRVHVGAELAVVAAPEPNPDASTLKDKLFFPGRGKLGGFSYLFMDKEEERQIEQVFYNFLKREHAWLEGPRTGIPAAATASGPLVSVVTPVYNRATFIGKAIESVQRQTINDWEYLIVDNGSTDATRDVVREYAAKDRRIRLIENDQNVIALSLNLGVRAAQGRFVAQLDSDDEYLPHTLKLMTGALLANPTWGLAISYYELTDEAGNSLPEFGVIRHEQYNRNNILRRDGAGALRCWHRSVILEFGGFDEKELGHYGEDYDLVLKCGEKYEVGRVHEVCYRYRRHGDNTDVLRAPEMKISNKTKARLNAIERRKLKIEN
ncbi:glycosyltransferase [candidate division KSB1 bacterium]|nr:glycosyltransferase [candidate division KSB1 bacterium]